MLRRILFTTIAVALAAAGTAGVGLYARSADARALQGQETVEAYVATKTVPQGTTAQAAVDDGLIQLEKLARKNVPTGALTQVTTDVKSLVTQAEVPAGSLVMRTVFGAMKKATPSGMVVPRGKVAVSVQLEDQARLAGLLTVGSNVAVFDTFNVYKGAGAPRTNSPSGDGITGSYEKVQATRLVIPKAEVLAVGQTTSAQPSSSDGKSGGTSSSGSSGGQTSTLVTLAVTQAEAERLINVAQVGHPWFALLGNSEVQPGPGVDNRGLFTNGNS